MRMIPGKLGFFRTFALLAALVFATQLGAEPATTTAADEVAPAATAVEESAAVVVEDEATAEVVDGAQCGAADASAWSEVVATNAAWQTGSSSCQYTCPMNIVLLCPNFPGVRPVCVNGCCYYVGA